MNNTTATTVDYAALDKALAPVYATTVELKAAALAARNAAYAAADAAYRVADHAANLLQVVTVRSTMVAHGITPEF